MVPAELLHCEEPIVVAKLYACIYRTIYHTGEKINERKKIEHAHVLIIEPVSEKSNNLGPNQVWHKLGCSVTEDG